MLIATMPFVIDKSKSKKGASVSYLTEVQWDISDFTFVRNKDYQYCASHLIS